MTVGTILALVILISFLVTLILAIGSYTAYKLREARRPRPIFQADSEFQFFERYVHTREAQVQREKRVAEREASGEVYDNLTTEFRPVWTTDPGKKNTDPGKPKSNPYDHPTDPIG